MQAVDSKLRLAAHIASLSNNTGSSSMVALMMTCCKRARRRSADVVMRITSGIDATNGVAPMRDVMAHATVERAELKMVIPRKSRSARACAVG